MEFQTLNNGIKIPVLGFGVWQIFDQKECQKAVEDALSVGYRLIDTASLYRNEEAVGRAIKASGIPREDIFLTSKAWISQLGYEDTKLALKETLRKLDTDYLDLYLIHQPFGDLHGAWRAMIELKHEELIRAIGVSNFSTGRLPIRPSLLWYATPCWTHISEKTGCAERNNLHRGTVKNSCRKTLDCRQQR